MNAMMQIPLYLQEVFQLVIWFDLIQEGAISPADEPRSECSRTNLFSSFAITLIITGLPSWSCFVARRWVIDFYKKGFPFSIFKIYASRIQMYWVTVMAYCSVGWYIGWYPFCTAIGPNGHQVWPVVFSPHRVVRYAHPFLYAYVLDRGLQPWMMVASYYLLAFMSFSAIVILIMWWRIGWEAGSFWCFSASLTCFVSLIEPYLFKRFGRRNLLGVKAWTWTSVKVYRKYGNNRDVGLLAEKEGVFAKGTYHLLPQDQVDEGEVESLIEEESSKAHGHNHTHGGVACHGHNAGSTFHKMGKQQLSAMGIDPL